MANSHSSRNEKQKDKMFLMKLFSSLNCAFIYSHPLFDCSLDYKSQNECTVAVMIQVFTEVNMSNVVISEDSVHVLSTNRERPPTQMHGMFVS